MKISGSQNNSWNKNFLWNLQKIFSNFRRGHYYATFTTLFVANSEWHVAIRNYHTFVKNRLNMKKQSKISELVNFKIVPKLHLESFKIRRNVTQLWVSEVFFLILKFRNSSFFLNYTIFCNIFSKFFAIIESFGCLYFVSYKFWKYFRFYSFF